LVNSLKVALVRALYPLYPLILLLDLLQSLLDSHCAASVLSPPTVYKKPPSHPSGGGVSGAFDPAQS